MQGVLQLLGAVLAELDSKHLLQSVLSAAFTTRPINTAAASPAHQLHLRLCCALSRAGCRLAQRLPVTLGLRSTWRVQGAWGSHMHLVRCQGP